MDQAASPLIAGLTIFTLAISAGFFILWLRARRLRDALVGRDEDGEPVLQDGYRLMKIFCNLFLVTGVTLFLNSLRQVLFLAAPTETELFRYILAFGGTLAILGVFAWALVEVRAIINAGRRDEDEV